MVIVPIVPERLQSLMVTGIADREDCENGGSIGTIQRTFTRTVTWGFCPVSSLKRGVVPFQRIRVTPPSSGL